MLTISQASANFPAFASQLLTRCGSIGRPPPPPPPRRGQGDGSGPLISTINNVGIMANLLVLLARTLPCFPM